MRPIAEAGFFQTGRVVAIKCHVDAGENLSVCRGGGACLETENPTVNCVGNFSNECAEGSTGRVLNVTLPQTANPKLRNHLLF